MEFAFKTVLVAEILMFLSCLSFGFFFIKLIRALQQEAPSLKFLIPVMLAGLLLRIGWIAYTQPLPQSDFQVYWEFANNFYRGQLDYPEITRHPGVIFLFTFVFYLLGPSLLSGWIMNLAFSLVLMILVYGVARLLFTEKNALLATAMAAFLPQLITYSALFASEIPAVMFAFMALWAILYARKTQQLGWGYWLALGVLLYGCVLIRSTLMLYLIVLPLLFAIYNRGQFKAFLSRYLVMVVTTGALLFTWAYHQSLITGSFKLFWGTGYWLSNIVEYKTHGHYVPTDRVAVYAKAEPYIRLGTLAGKAKAQEVLQEESVKIILQDPGRYLFSGFTRVKDTLWTSQTGIRWSERGSKTLQAWPGKWVKKLCTASNLLWQVVFCLFPLGFLAYRRTQDAFVREGMATIGLFLISWILFHYFLAIGSERYGFQVIPFVLVMAAAGGEQLFTVCKFLCPPLGKGEGAAVCDARSITAAGEVRLGQS